MDIELKQLANKFFIIVAVLIVGVLIFFMGQMVYQMRYLDLQNQYQITVSGEGKVYAKPDVATVSLGIKTDGQSVADITKQNVNAVNKIISDIKKLQIPENDIQTTQYTVTPNYTWTSKEGTVPNGYTIQQTVDVKIRDFDKISNVLQTAANDGANVVNSLQFTVDNPAQFRQEARAKAIEQARANAENLAKSSGVKLGKIINVYEGYNPTPVIYNSMKSVGGAGAADSSVPAPTIQPGQQEIQVTINLTYQVK